VEISTKGVVEVIAIATMPIAIVAVVWHRVRTDMGLGVRAIQFLGLAIFAPTVLILALEGMLARISHRG
jgi:hypothetical protein